MNKLAMGVGGTILLLVMGCSGQRPLNLGVTNGLLAPCPASPNCVSSESHDQEHFSAPLEVQHDPRTAIRRLANLIKHLPRTTVVKMTDRYLYVEFRSRLWGFVDDVEFYLAPGSNLIQVRSASRLGYGDFGVNRKRIEKIRRLWQTAQNQTSPEGQ